MLQKLYPGDYKHSAEEYLRLIAISAILLPNIPHLQASWLTVGLPVAMLCLHAGADDLGSVMIEENVVSAAGASFRTDADGIKKPIIGAGFKPRYRNQKYETEVEPG
jgi:cyclic dehypoxanthinyl futalosine synthase